MGFAASARNTAPRPQDASVGAYLTDETKLIRIESVLRTREGDELVEVEDCRTLDRWIWPVDELERNSMRRVQPARPGWRIAHVGE